MVFTFTKGGDCAMNKALVSLPRPSYYDTIPADELAFEELRRAVELSRDIVVSPSVTKSVENFAQALESLSEDKK